MNIYFPIQLPVRFYKYNKIESFSYKSRLMDEYAQINTILSNQEKVFWVQNWQSGDILRLQIMSDTPGLSLGIYNCKGIMISSTPFVKKETEWKEQGTEVYEIEKVLLSSNEIVYFAICLEDKILCISDAQEVLFEYPDSLLFEYNHRKNVRGLAFKTGIKFEFRTPGVISTMLPELDVVSFIDQQRDPILLSSNSWHSYEAIVGDSLGSPDYIGRLVSEIMSLSEVYIDGIKYSLTQDSKIDKKSIDGWSLSGWRFKITPSENKKLNKIEISEEDQEVLLYDTRKEVLINDKNIYYAT